MGYDESTLLFAKPSFVRGMGRAIDLGATRDVYNDSKSPKEADTKALRTDWVATGKDIRKAMNSQKARA